MTSPRNHIMTRFKERVKNTPEKPALHFFQDSNTAAEANWHALSYQDLDQKTDAYANGFVASGISPGTKVIVMVSYSPELFCTLFALFKMGAIPVIIDPGMGINRMLHCYEKVGADAFIGIPIAQVVRVLRPRFFSSIKTVITVGRKYGWGGNTLGALESQYQGQPFHLSNVKTDDLLMINFTTGSTGPAKGVEYTHGMIYTMLLAMEDNYHISSQHIGLVTLPLFALIDLFMGCESVLAPMDPTQPAKVDAQKIIDTIEQFQVNHMFASPALIHRITPECLKHPQRLSTLHRVACGGAPVTMDVLKGIADALPNHVHVETSYGATEALPISSIEHTEIVNKTANDSTQHQGTCVGKPVKGIQLKIINITDTAEPVWHDGLECQPAEVGEIVVRGGAVSQSYHHDEHENTLMKIPDSDGRWHRTGDLGWVDDEQRLWFCGRKKHRVETREHTLFSVQVENIFNQHKAVYRSALVALGEGKIKTAAICIELKEETHQTQEQLLDELRALAEKHSITEHIEHILFHHSFPVDIRHNAKINRGELQEWAEVKLGIRAMEKAPFWLSAIPVLGWIYLFVGIVWPFSHPVLQAIWWIDFFLSVVVHGFQIPLALPNAKRWGISKIVCVVKTLIFGATYWRFLQPATASHTRSDG